MYNPEVGREGTKGGTGVERNTPIKEVSMGIYARVNSRQREFQAVARTRCRFVIVLCSRLTASNNELTTRR